MGCASSRNARRMSGDPGTLEQSSVNGRKNPPLTESEIQQRIDAPKAIQVTKLSDVSMQYAWVSQRGYYPDAPNKDNQDSFSALVNFGSDPDRAFFAVYDGHGKDGHLCARFARDHLPGRVQQRLSSLPSLNSAAIKQAITIAHFDTNETLHANRLIDDSLSGTTSISVLFLGSKMFINNIGDSRAILVSLHQNGRLVAKALSSDQTPYRADERERVKKYGARILSLDQIEGIEPVHENWGELTLGEDIDEGGDPPRIWAPNGDYPGTAFTRSFGDMYAEKLGVTAEPEILERDLMIEDKMVIIASDGVFEFLTNQMVADIASRYHDPLEACKAIVSASYDLWLQYEIRTDDITVIVIYVDDIVERQDNVVSDGITHSIGSIRENNTTITSNHVTVELDSTPEIHSNNRPVRRNPSRERRNLMIHASNADIEESDSSNNNNSDNINGEFELQSLVTVKEDSERAAILSAIKNNFLFQHMNAAQRQLIVDVMQPMEVKAGDWVIRQGDRGDRFYVIEKGVYEVRMKPKDMDDPTGGTVVHVYESGHEQHPGFGELSLMYDKPRAASVIALTDGKLWALDRRVFKKAVMRSSDTRKNILRTLRRVELLSCLNLPQLQRLADLFNDREYATDEYIIRQGEIGDEFYIIAKGQCDCTIIESDGVTEKTVMRLRDNDYFGEKALLSAKPRAANVIAKSPTKVLYLCKAAFEEVLGPLSAIIQSDQMRRERLAANSLHEKTVAVLSDIDLIGVVNEDNIGQTILGKFGSQKPNVTIRSFIFSEVEKASLSRSVVTLIETAKAVTANTKSYFLPSLRCILRESNAFHVIFNSAIVCDLFTIISNAKQRKVEEFKIGEENEEQQVVPNAESSCDVTRAQPLLTEEVIYIVACIINALQTLHEIGVIYRSIQPESVFMDSQGVVVLADYRVSKVSTIGGKTYTLCGAAEYLSPEQISQRGHGTPVDLWALGVLIYELSVGIHPFSSNSEVATYSKISSFGSKTFPSLHFPTHISSEMKSLINQLLVPTPEARLGAQPGGFANMKKHSLFRGVVNWNDFESSLSPLVNIAESELQSIINDGFDNTILTTFEKPFSSASNWEENVDISMQ